MKTTTRLGVRGAAYVGLFSIMAMVSTAPPAMASKYPPDPVEPLVAVTPETLDSLHASTYAKRVSPQLVLGMPLDIDGMSDQGTAPIALSDAFPTLPLCQEWGPSGETPRFPFEVQRDERLTDALDRLNHNSNGFLNWALLHGRIVLMVQGPASAIMDRSVQVEVNAETLMEALEQVEAAYNDRYFDRPVISSPLFARLVLRTRPLAAGKARLFELRTEAPLREVVLTILDQMEDPAVCYSLSELTDAQKRQYYALRMRKRDAPELDIFTSAEDHQIHDDLMEAANQRLDAYLTENATKAAQAAGERAAGEATTE